MTSPAERALYTTAGTALVVYASAERRMGQAIRPAQRIGGPPARTVSLLLPRSTRLTVAVATLFGINTILLFHLL